MAVAFNSGDDSIISRQLMSEMDYLYKYDPARHALFAALYRLHFPVNAEGITCKQLPVKSRRVQTWERRERTIEPLPDKGRLFSFRLYETGPYFDTWTLPDTQELN